MNNFLLVVYLNQYFGNLAPVPYRSTVGNSKAFKANRHNMTNFCVIKQSAIGYYNKHSNSPRLDNLTACHLIKIPVAIGY